MPQDAGDGYVVVASGEGFTLGVPPVRTDTLWCVSFLLLHKLYYEIRDILQEHLLQSCGLVSRALREYWWKSDREYGIVGVFMGNQCCLAVSTAYLRCEIV